MEGDEGGNNRITNDKFAHLKKEHYDSVFDLIRTLMQCHGYPRKGDRYKALMSQTSFSTLTTSQTSSTSTMSQTSSTSTMSQTSSTSTTSQTSSTSTTSQTSSTSTTSQTSSTSTMSQTSSTSTMSQTSSTSTASQTSSSMRMTMVKQENPSPPGFGDEQKWVPVFPNLENMNQMMLQALEASMIVLSTDGVIFFVTENITSVLGYLAHEVMGRKLLSFLPEGEKNEVYQKITMKLPLSESVGTHVDFCCHLKRGNVKQNASPTYEHVKFILTLRDICSKSFVFFGGFVPNCLCLEPTAMKFPMEDRFFLVGSVCVINTAILKELYTTKQFCEIVTKQESDEENSLEISRRLGGRASEMNDAAASSDDQITPVKVEQYEQQEFPRVDFEESSSSSATSISSSEVIPDSLTTTFHAFALGSMMDKRRCQDPVDIEFTVNSDDLERSQDAMNWEEPMMREDLMEPMVQDALMEPIIQDTLIKPIEETLMEPVMQENLPSSGVAASPSAQVQPAASRHVANGPEPWGVEETHRKQCPGKVKHSFSDSRESKRFCIPSRLGMFIEGLEDSSNTSTQELEPKIQQQEGLQIQQEEKPETQQEEKPEIQQEEEPEIQQEEEPEMQQEEEPEMQQEEKPEMQQEEKPEMQQQKKPEMQQEAELQVQQEEKPEMHQEAELQVQQEQKSEMQQEAELPRQPQMLQKQVLEEQQRQEQQLQQEQGRPSVSPFQMRAEQRRSGGNQEKDCENRGDGSSSIRPVEQPESRVVVAASASSSESISAASLSQSSVSPLSDFNTEEFIEVWLDSPDSREVFLELDNWSASEQRSSQNQASWQQVGAPEAGAQASAVNQHRRRFIPLGEYNLECLQRQQNPRRQP